MICILFPLSERREYWKPPVFALVTVSVHRTLTCKWVHVPWPKLKRKRISFRISVSFWCARRDLNSRNLEYMVFLKLLFAQNARFVSNIPIFPTDIFALILLRVFVRVKIRVNTTPVHQQIVVVAVLELLAPCPILTF